MPREKAKNRRKVERANRALTIYGVRTEGDAAVIDLLADLRHFCEARGMDFDDLNRIAGNHYTDEGGANR